MVIRDGTGAVPYGDMLPGFVGAVPLCPPVYTIK